MKVTDILMGIAIVVVLAAILPGVIALFLFPIQWLYDEARKLVKGEMTIRHAIDKALDNPLTTTWAVLSFILAVVMFIFFPFKWYAVFAVPVMAAGLSYMILASLIICFSIIRLIYDYFSGLSEITFKEAIKKFILDILKLVLIFVLIYIFLPFIRLLLIFLHYYD